MNNIEVINNSLQNETVCLSSIAALFKGDFSIDMLMELTGKKATEVLQEIESCLQDGSISSKRSGVFFFSDKAKQKELQEALTEKTQEQLHNHIARVILNNIKKQEGMSDNQELLLELADHLIRTTNDINTCPFLIQAGDIYRKNSDTEKALKCYTKIIDDLHHSDDEISDRLFADAAIKYSRISTGRHNTATEYDMLQTALEKAIRRKRPDQESLIEMNLAKTEWLRSNYRNALTHFRKGWSLANEIADPRLLSAARVYSSFFLHWQGRYEEAVHSYEQYISEVESFPHGSFPLQGAITAAHCYTQIGQFTHGLGMLDALRLQCLDRSDAYLLALADLCIGMGLIQINRHTEAITHLKDGRENALKSHNNWVVIMGDLAIAYAYYTTGHVKLSLEYLQEFIHQSNRVQVTVRPYHYLFELCWAMELGKFPHIPEISLENEISSAINGSNVFTKGIAYRFHALLQERSGASAEQSINILKTSLKHLEKSGNHIEITKTITEMVRNYLLLGDEKTARALMDNISSRRSYILDCHIPDELRVLMNVAPISKEWLLEELLNLTRKVVTIRDHRELANLIISTVNHITGTERGAIFATLYHPPRLSASRNLTQEQISHVGFQSSMEMIKTVAATGKGQITGINEKSNLVDAIRSKICVPMKLRNKVVGVMYHDNRLLESTFREADLPLLDYFAAMAAFALDNAKVYEEIKQMNEKILQEKRYLEDQQFQRLSFGNIIGESAPMKNLSIQIEKVSNTDATVLIHGETGVGKELVASAIHHNSSRKDKPFIRVHCSALPESLIPSELFGHEKGAFTGAIKRHLGRFELANEGTLFLDEIGELSPDVQVRLLRVLQTKKFERIGGSETLQSDFRLIVATNRNLEKEVQKGTFRSDLYYRLNVFPIYVPPLRERIGDIPLLVNHFTKLYATKRGKIFERIPEAEMNRLIQYDWPGNVRELENIIERATILSSSPLLKIPPLKIIHPDHAAPAGDVSLQANEKKHILWALDKCEWKIHGTSGAASLLKLPPSTLISKMKKLDIRRPPKEQISKSIT